MRRGTKTNIIALLLSFMMVLVCFASDATIVTAHAEEMEECSLGEATCTEDVVGCSVDEEHVAGAVVKTQDVAGTKMYNWAYQVLDLVNQERAKAGVAPLSMDVEMLERARAHRDEHTYVATNMDELQEILDTKPGFVKAMWCEDRACEDMIKEKFSATSRCMPFEQETLAETCVCCGKPAKKMVYWGRAY